MLLGVSGLIIIITGTRPRKKQEMSRHIVVASRAGINIYTASASQGERGPCWGGVCSGQELGVRKKKKKQHKKKVTKRKSGRSHWRPHLRRTSAAPDMTCKRGHPPAAYKDYA